MSDGRGTITAGIALIAVATLLPLVAFAAWLIGGMGGPAGVSYVLAFIVAPLLLTGAFIVIGIRLLRRARPDRWVALVFAGLGTGLLLTMAVRAMLGAS